MGGRIRVRVAVFESGRLFPRHFFSGLFFFESGRYESFSGQTSRPDSIFRSESVHFGNPNPSGRKLRSEGRGKVSVVWGSWFFFPIFTNLDIFFGS